MSEFGKFWQASMLSIWRDEYINYQVTGHGLRIRINEYFWCWDCKGLRKVVSRIVQHGLGAERDFATELRSQVTSNLS